MKNNPFSKVFEIPKNFFQKVLRRVKGRALAHPFPTDNPQFVIDISCCFMYKNADIHLCAKLPKCGLPSENKREDVTKMYKIQKNVDKI